MKIELKPCPFCGGGAEMRQFANPKNFYCVVCNKCGCGTDGHRVNCYKGTDAENKKANAEVWNKRVN